MSIAGSLSRRRYIGLEYPPSADDQPRWGRGKPLHPQLTALFESDIATWAETADSIVSYADSLAAIGTYRTDEETIEPRWNAGNLPGLDGAALYAFTRERRPARFIEVGSGNSTKFVARAIRDGCLDTSLISIDPFPRADIDRLCERIIRNPLELTPPTQFADLEAGDMVFFDGSHRVFMNSDVTVFFLDILPSLPAGVLVGIHDISLPEDYSAPTARRYWSEQYLLAAFLLGGHRGTRIRFPAAYVRHVPVLERRLEPLWRELPPVETHGDIFWLETVS